MTSLGLAEITNARPGDAFTLNKSTLIQYGDDSIWRINGKEITHIEDYVRDLPPTLIMD